MLIQLITLLVAGSTTHAQDQATGSVQSSTSNRVSVKPNCFRHEMQIMVDFHTPPFRDWLVMGQTGREECLTHGDGSTQYLLHVQLANDACGTTMVSPGVFENVLTIQSHPHLNLILDNDERIVVRCTYGSPKVKPHIMPQLPPTRARAPFTTVLNREQATTEIPTRESNTLIILIIFLVLILAVLFLLCGCVYYFLRRRRVRLERRNKLLLAVPPGSEIGQGLWWPGKPTLSNDALLSHDYMVSSNSTQEPLSVSTGEYANESQSSGSASNASPPDTVATATTYDGQVFVHETRHMIPRAHAENTSARAMKSLHSIPEENSDSVRSDAIASGLYHSWKREMDKLSPGSVGSEETLSPRQAQHRHEGYATVDPTTKKSRQSPSQHSDSSRAQSHHNLPPDRYASEMRSMSEIYTLPPADKEGSGEIAHLPAHERVQYVDVHGEVLEVDAGNLPTMSRKVKADVHFEDEVAQRQPIDWEVYIRAIEQHRGKGPRKLSDDEIQRWGIQLRSDERLQHLVQSARTLEDFEMITHHPQYENMYSGEKWAIIVQSLAHVAFMKKLNRIIEPTSPEESTENLHAGSSSAMGGRSGRSSIRSALKGSSRSNGDIPEALRASSRAEKEERIFTRDSYSKVKSDIGSVSGDESLYDIRIVDNLPQHRSGGVDQNGDNSFGKVTRDRSTTEIIEKNKTVLRVNDSGNRPADLNQRYDAVSSSREDNRMQSFDNPPTLSVYMGNVPARSLEESVDISRLPSRDSFYNALPGQSVTDISMEQTSSRML